MTANNLKALSRVSVWRENTPDIRARSQVMKTLIISFRRIHLIKTCINYTKFLPIILLNPPKSYTLVLECHLNSECNIPPGESPEVAERRTGLCRRGQWWCIWAPPALCRNTPWCRRSASPSAEFYFLPRPLGSVAAAGSRHGVAARNPLSAAGSAYRGRGGCSCSAERWDWVWGRASGPDGTPREWGRWVWSGNLRGLPHLCSK